MNRTSRTVRLAFAIASIAITGTLFQSVASLSRPTAIEQVAMARKTTVIVASVAAPTAATKPAVSR